MYISRFSIPLEFFLNETWVRRFVYIFFSLCNRKVFLKIFSPNSAEYLFVYIKKPSFVIFSINQEMKLAIYHSFSSSSALRTKICSFLLVCLKGCSFLYHVSWEVVSVLMTLSCECDS
jgi:hypothetical protein